MPISAKDRNRLKNGAKVHRIMADLADDPKVLEALNALADSADEREKMKKNPDKWVKDRKIKLPPKTTVTFFEGSWRVELTIDVDGSLFGIGFDSGSGFYTTK